MLSFVLHVAMCVTAALISHNYFAKGDRYTSFLWGVISGLYLAMLLRG